MIFIAFMITVSPQVDPLHEDVGNIFTKRLVENLWLKSLQTHFTFIMLTLLSTLHSLPSTSILMMIVSVKMLSNISLLVTD